MEKTLIQRIEEKLVEFGVIELAKKPIEIPAESGSTEETATTGETVSNLPSVVIVEFTPKNGKISYSAIGAPVLSISPEGEEEPAEDGDYDTVDGKTITVVDGKLTKEIDTPEEDVKEDEAETSGTTQMSSQETEVELANAETQRIRDLIDMSKNGEYTISVSVQEGKIIYGKVYSSTVEDIMMSEETKISEKVVELEKAYETKMADEAKKYESIIEALKVGETKVETKVVEEKPKPLTKSDYMVLELEEKRKNNR